MQEIMNFKNWCQNQKLKASDYRTLQQYLQDKYYIVEAYYLDEEMICGSVTYYDKFDDLDERCEMQLSDEDFDGGYVTGKYEWTKGRLFFASEEDYLNESIPVGVQIIENGELTITLKEEVDMASNWNSYERVEV